MSITRFYEKCVGQIGFKQSVFLSFSYWSNPHLKLFVEGVVEGTEHVYSVLLACLVVLSRITEQPFSCSLSNISILPKVAIADISIHGMLCFVSETDRFVLKFQLLAEIWNWWCWHVPCRILQRALWSHSLREVQPRWRVICKWLWGWHTKALADNSRENLWPLEVCSSW